MAMPLLEAHPAQHQELEGRPNGPALDPRQDARRRTQFRRIKCHRNLPLLVAALARQTGTAQPPTFTTVDDTPVLSCVETGGGAPDQPECDFSRIATGLRRVHWSVQDTSWAAGWK